MANTTSPLLPGTALQLQHLGERLRLARLRRRLQSQQVAERAGMSVITLRKIERGDPGVSMGAYLAVLQVLQLHGDLDKLAADDPLGRRLQDIEGEGGMRPRRRRSAQIPAYVAAAVEKKGVMPADGGTAAISGDDLFAYLASLSSSNSKKGSDD